MYLKSNKLNRGSCLRIRIISFNYCFYTFSNLFSIYIKYTHKLNWQTVCSVSNIPPRAVVEHLQRKFVVFLGFDLNVILQDVLDDNVKHLEFDSSSGVVTLLKN